ncbi:hypothetical protein GCM10010518_58600 [Kitasatospora cinereorecta]
MNRFRCVTDLHRRYGVKRLCSILGVSRSSFCYWRRTAADRAARQAADAQLAARIRAVHQESDGTYGVPRITAELRETSGEAVNHKRVARIMRASGIEGVRLRRRHRTTVPDPTAAKAPDLIGRDFSAEKPNTKYVGDITYLPIDGGKFCYLATVIDLASRRLAGWAIADHMRADLVTDALAAAVRTRGSLAESIMHTDHGAQYTSRAFAEACRSAGVRRSMSAVGSSADNALAESFNATFKRETLQGRKSWPDERQARLDAFRWLHRYNTRRRHSHLGQRSPIAYEGIAVCFQHFSDVEVLLDDGYLGLSRDHRGQAITPPRKPRPGALPSRVEQWERDRHDHSSDRISVEHALADHKRWKQLTRWTHRRDRLPDTYRAIAGLVSDRTNNG